jgi:hypothetical protein
MGAKVHEFFTALDAAREMQQAESEQQFSARVLKKFCEFFELGKPPHDAGLEWIRNEYPSFRIRLEAKKVKVDVRALFVAATRTDVWAAYFDRFNDDNDVKTGLVSMAMFAPSSHGIMVVHNCWSLPVTPGYTRLVRHAKKGDMGIIMEPLEAFLESVKTGGMGP